MAGEWAKGVLKASKLIAKVLLDNKASQCLLSKMGFKECGINDKFGELLYEK